MSVLQRQIGQWHRRRFPAATDLEITVKACAELGELAEAVGSRAPSSPGIRGDVLAEAADVVICLMALVDRYDGGDLLLEAEAKWRTLSDPDSGHRSA